VVQSHPCHVVAPVGGRVSLDCEWWSLKSCEEEPSPEAAVMPGRFLRSRGANA
jgi:hypothetical protein